ncbi:MAG: FG-GAP repeat protein [Verrucomicrobiales bacterium]
MDPAGVSESRQCGGGDRFGGAVAISGDTVVVGALGEDSGASGVNSVPDESASSAGAAYVFVRNGGTWSQQAYLKPGNPGASDLFGTSVAVSGDTVAVGARREDGGSSGVNGTPNDDVPDTGAVYVFVRNGAAWSQHGLPQGWKSWEPPMNSGSPTGFPGTRWCCTYFEDSGTSGVNSIPDESASSAGAPTLLSGMARRGPSRPT